MRAYRVSHKAQIAAQRRLLQLAKGRAKKLGLDYDLTPGCFTVPARCPVLDIPLFFTMRGFSDNAPTLDRIDNRRGYVVGNVIVVSWRANRIKCDASPSELKRIAEFYWRA